jgi:tetratricopeptide (TPR) repeat protein
MKKNILMLIAGILCCFTTILRAQTQIGIAVITDEFSGTDRTFAIAEFIAQKKYNGANGVLEPKLVDYVYGKAYGLSGKLSPMMASFVLYKDGKSIAQVSCENKWELISPTLDAELVKLGFTSSVSKVKIDEGDAVKVYEKKMANNLPGATSFELPKNIHSDEFKINAAEIEYFEPKDITKELKELYGKYGGADITDSKFFKSKDVPKELKEAVKPLASPVGKTMLMPALYISYGNALLEQKDYETAQHCYLQAIAGSNELIGSSKDKANIRAYAFAKLATLQNSIAANRSLLAKLYNTCAALNKSGKLGEQMNTEHTTYYKNVRQVQEICTKAEQNARSARASRFSAMMGAVTSGIGGGIASSGPEFASLTSSVNVLEATTQKSQDQLIENMRFKEELRTMSFDINSENFITGAGGMENCNSFLAGETLYFLSQYKDDVKDVLDEYAADKPVLAKLLSDFYAASTKPERNKILKGMFKHLAEMEYTIANFETRNIVVPEKYTSGF